MSSCPVSTLHIRTLQSPTTKPVVFPLQEATSEPSAEKLTPLTCELYFGFKLVTTLTTLCNGRLRLCRFLEVSGNTFVILVYVSPPVTGGETQRFAKAAHLCPVKVRSRGRLATFRKMRLPVALELLELLASVNIPQPDRLVARPTDKQGGIRWIETDAIYRTAAIFSNVSFTGTTLRLSPPESTPLPR